MNQSILKPIQPYFVLNTETEYLKRESNMGNIAHFYRFTVSHASDEMLVVPDASIDVIFCLDINNPYAQVCGCLHKPTRLSDFKPNTPYFGVRYQIGTAPEFLKDDYLKGITENKIPLEDILPTAKFLIEQIASTQDFDRQIDIYTEACCNIDYVLKPALHQTVRDLMLEHRGIIRVDEISEYTKSSIRTINHSFTHYYGLSPKTFALIVRYQDALQQLTKGQANSLTDLALDLGYSDQSHFLKSFKQHNLSTPRQFKKMIEEYDYQQHILNH